MVSPWVAENTKLHIALTKRGFYPVGRYTYLQDLTSVTIKPTLTTEGVMWHLVTINVPKLCRRQGLASITMEGIIDAADEHEKALILEVVPDDDKDIKWLKTWYSKLGFKSVNELLMVRQYRSHVDMV